MTLGLACGRIINLKTSQSLRVRAGVAERIREEKHTSIKTFKTLVSLQLRWSKCVSLASKSKHIAVFRRLIAGFSWEAREKSTER